MLFSWQRRHTVNIYIEIFESTLYTFFDGNSSYLCQGKQSLFLWTCCLDLHSVSLHFLTLASKLAQGLWVLDLTAVADGCVGNSVRGTRYGSTFSGVVWWLPGYRRQRAVTPGYSRYRALRRGKVWGQRAQASASQEASVVLFPTLSFSPRVIAFQPRPLFSCSVFSFLTVICSAAPQVSLGIPTVGSITLGWQQIVWKQYLSITNALCPGQSRWPLSRAQLWLCFLWGDKLVSHFTVQSALWHMQLFGLLNNSFVNWDF